MIGSFDYCLSQTPVALTTWRKYEQGVTTLLRVTKYLCKANVEPISDGNVGEIISVEIL